MAGFEMFVFVVLFSLNLVFFPCQGKIIPPPCGKTLLVAPGSDQKVEWTFDNDISSVLSRAWFFRRSDGSPQEILASISDNEEFKIRSNILTVEIIKPATLVLKKVNSSFSGTYQFSVQATGTTVSDIKVFVGTPNVTINCSSPITVKEGANITCVCKDETTSPPGPVNVTWYKNGKNIRDTGVEELILSSVKESDGGKYACKADHCPQQGEESIQIKFNPATIPPTTILSETKKTTTTKSSAGKEKLSLSMSDCCEWYISLVFFVSGAVVGILLSCIVSYCRRRFKKSQSNPEPKMAKAISEPHAPKEACSVYEDLDLTKMNADDNYQSLTVNSNDIEYPMFAGLDGKRDKEDNYEPLNFPPN